MTKETKLNPYDGSGHGADRDAATVAELLAIIVEEGCNLGREGMTPAQVAATTASTCWPFSPATLLSAFPKASAAR